MARGGLIERPDPERRERIVAAALFFTTCTSVFLVHMVGWQDGDWSDPVRPARAAAFTATLMGILLAHELGHYAMARYHGFRLSMPWFLPLPWLVGTLGAVIRLREAPRSRTGLLEMGAAGPLAGMAVVFGVLCVWVAWGPVAARPGDLLLTRPLAFWLVHGALVLEAPPQLTTRDPLGFAAWIGCLVTGMNLLPFGQLDGGHIAAAVVPTRAGTIGWVVTGLLLILAFAWPAWALWVVVLHVLGTRHAVQVRRDREPPSVRAKCMAGVAALVFIVTFMPVPVP